MKKLFQNVSYSVFCMILFVLLLIAMLLGIYIGAVNIRVDWIFEIIINQLFRQDIFAPQWPESAVSIIWQLRFPKVLAAACIGASLSLSGIMMQALTKNALAEPFVLGISSGAATGAVAALLMGGLPLIGSFSTSAGAFGGALLTSFLVFVLANARGNPSTTRLVLTGMAMAASFGALTNLIIFLTPDTHKINSAMFWMTGSLSGVYWKNIPLIVSAFFLGLCITLLLNRSLDALLMGEERAVTLGVDTKKLKRILIITSSLLTGIMVSVSGVIGFVGLVVPHIARTLFGAAHRRMIPVAMLMGGIFMVAADILARVLAKPEEMPIGIITALIGAPFFLGLLYHSSYKFGE